MPASPNVRPFSRPLRAPVVGVRFTVPTAVCPYCLEHFQSSKRGLHVLRFHASLRETAEIEKAGR